MAEGSIAGPAGDSGPDEPLTIEWMVERWLSDVFAYAWRLSGSELEAEEICQQTFLLAQQRLAQLRDPRRCRAWLLTIARNCFLKRCRRPQATNATDLDLDLAQFGEGVPEGVEGDEVDEERLRRAVASLPEPYRVVVLMYYFEQLSYREIAQQLDVPMGTVMSRLARGKRCLRNDVTTAQSRR